MYAPLKAHVAALAEELVRLLPRPLRLHRNDSRGVEPERRQHRRPERRRPREVPPGLASDHERHWGRGTRRWGVSWRSLKPATLACVAVLLAYRVDVLAQGTDDFKHHIVREGGQVHARHDGRRAPSPTQVLAVWAWRSDAMGRSSGNPKRASAHQTLTHQGPAHGPQILSGRVTTGKSKTRRTRFCGKIASRGRRSQDCSISVAIRIATAV